MAGSIAMSTDKSAPQAEAASRDWLRLLTWLSPAFPVGGFSYSSGLEAAVRHGAIADRGQLHDWLSASLDKGTLWNDAILLGAAMQEGADIAPINALALALSGSPGRHLETSAQGAAFVQAANHWADLGAPDEAIALPVAVALAARRAGITPADAAAAFLGAAIANQLQAAIRLGVMGQEGAVAVQRALEDVILQTAQTATSAGLDGLGGCTMLAEIAALQHATLEGRLFRS